MTHLNPSGVDGSHLELREPLRSKRTRLPQLAQLNSKSIPPLTPKECLTFSRTKRAVRCFACWNSILVKIDSVRECVITFARTPTEIPKHQTCGTPSRQLRENPSATRWIRGFGNPGIPSCLSHSSKMSSFYSSVSSRFPTGPMTRRG